MGQAYTPNPDNVGQPILSLAGPGREEQPTSPAPPQVVLSAKAPPEEKPSVR